MSAAIDISFLRALSAPCTWATSVLSVSKTTTFGESAVCKMTFAPLLALITPSIFVCAKAIVPRDPANGSNRTVAAMIEQDGYGHTFPTYFSFCNCEFTGDETCCLQRLLSRSEAGNAKTLGLARCAHN